MWEDTGPRAGSICSHSRGSEGSSRYGCHRCARVTPAPVPRYAAPPQTCWLVRRGARSSTVTVSPRDLPFRGPHPHFEPQVQRCVVQSLVGDTVSKK